MKLSTIRRVRARLADKSERHAERFDELMKIDKVALCYLGAIAGTLFFDPHRARSFEACFKMDELGERLKAVDEVLKRNQPEFQKRYAAGLTSADAALVNVMHRKTKERERLVMKINALSKAMPR